MGKSRSLPPKSLPEPSNSASRGENDPWRAEAARAPRVSSAALQLKRVYADAAICGDSLFGLERVF
jgi:hypothetical protein